MKHSWLKKQSFRGLVFLLSGVPLGGTAFSGTALPATPSPAPVEYRLNGAPRANPECQDDADAVAAKFTSAGADVLSASCVKDDGISAEISLFLDANKVPPIYSAVFGHRVESLLTHNSSSTPINHRHDLGRAIGLFQTREACLAQVATRHAAFEQKTGLPVIATQCIPLGYGSGYVMQIDGFGTPRQRLTTYGHTFFTNQLDDSLPQKIADRLQSNGFEMIDMRWIGNSLLAIGWGEPNLDLQVVDFNWSNYFATPAECENQRMQLMSFLTANGRPVFHAECEKTQSRPMLLVLEELPSTGEIPNLVFEKIGRFGEFEACLARIPDRPSIASIGSFCSLDVAFDGRYEGYRLNRVTAKSPDDARKTAGF